MITHENLILVSDLDWHNVTYPCFVEPKIDGFRCLVTVDDDGTVKAFSRSGREWPKVADALQELSQFKDCWFDGELVIGGTWGSTNAAKNKGWNFDPDDLLFTIFDGNIEVFEGLLVEPPLKCRLVLNRVTIGMCKVANDQAEVEAMYSSALIAGFEGVVVKCDTNWMRLKPNMTVDYELNDGITLECKSDGTLLRVRTDK